MTRQVSIEREELNGVHEFVLRIDGERLGYLEFTRPEVGLMRIEYVEVSPELRGTGLGRQLVAKAIEFAKDDEASRRADLQLRARRDRTRSGDEPAPDRPRRGLTSPLHPRTVPACTSTSSAAFQVEAGRP